MITTDEILAVQHWAADNQVDELPVVTLPGGDISITSAAQKIFELVAPTEKMFTRGGAVMEPAVRDDGQLALTIVTPDALRSRIEKHARLLVWRTGANGERVLKPTTCNNDSAKALLATQEAMELLPRISGLVNCPVISEINGELLVANRGYHPSTNLLITDGDEIPDIEVGEATREILSLLSDFDFASQGDRSRAVASVLTPALTMGGFLKRRVPADVAEANQSQAGKTYRQRLVAAIYNEMPNLISNRAGGVGSVDESFNQALVGGRPFIQFDNFRGKFDSAHVEAFMTAEGSFSCRVPYRGEIQVQPEKFFIFLSSNGVDTTRDFANRSNIIRIRKQPQGFCFKTFEEGDLLDHVRHAQAYFLGCIFAIIREWHRQGMLRTNERGHDFQEWVQVVDWIVQHIFHLVPVMEGHRQAQEQVSNPQLVWLRQLAHSVHQSGQTQPLTASDLNEICNTANLKIPGLRAEADEQQAKRTIGIVLGKLFGTTDVLTVDGFRINRLEKKVARNNHLVGGSTNAKFYEFAKIDYKSLPQ